jgi:enamine deaminase RidA (YjgF/YER057c/UK114 family)
VERRLVPAESPFAATVGYSRALRVGPHVHVAGTAPIMPAGAEPPADAYGQAKRCLEVVVAALTELGAAPASSAPAPT